MTLKYQLKAEEFAQLDEAKQALYESPRII